MELDVAVIGASETRDALNNIATKFPATFKKAVGAECRNLQRSVAATLRNYRIVRFVPVPNLINATKWTAMKFTKRSAVTEMLRGKKNRSRLSKVGTIRINSIPGGFEVGHIGALAPYAVRFQDGVPRHVESKYTRHWMYQVLGKTMDIHTHEQLLGVIAPISPERKYIGPLAEKTQRDFVPGLVGCLDKIVAGEMKKAQGNKRQW